MSIASRRAAAILSTAIAIIVIMTIAATMTDAMTAVAGPIRRATPVSIVNP